MGPLSPLRVYCYTLPTPIGNFVLLIDDDGAVRFGNWTDHEEHAVERLRRAYRPQEIVIEVVRETEGTNSEQTNASTTTANKNNGKSSTEVIGRSYAVQQLKRYFDYPPHLHAGSNESKCHTDTGHRTRQEELQKLLDAVPIHYAPSTPFVRSVWMALRKVQFGEITTYGTLAKLCQHPNASRAVGYAMRENHICVLLPCHRVVGASRALTGFGAGLWRKAWLLRHEGAEIARELLQRAALVPDVPVKRKRSTVKVH